LLEEDEGPELPLDEVEPALLLEEDEGPELPLDEVDVEELLSLDEDEALLSLDEEDDPVLLLLALCPVCRTSQPMHPP
jgi:hypothetical protein